MKPLSALLAICGGNSPAIDEFTSQRPVTRSFGALFVRMNQRMGKNCESGDLRRLYDVIVMLSLPVVGSMSADGLEPRGV